MVQIFWYKNIDPVKNESLDQDLMDFIRIG